VAGAHAGDMAQLALSEGSGALSQDLFDALQSGWLDPIGGLSRFAVDEGKREHGWIGAEHELQPVLARCGAILDGEVEALTLSAQIEVGVAPGVQFRGSAQRLAAALVVGTLAGVVHEGNRGKVAALQGAQEAEQWGDLAGNVLIDGTQVHEGNKDEELGPQVGNGGAECLPRIARAPLTPI
jgi:hypothetical protein